MTWAYLIEVCRCTRILCFLLGIIAFGVGAIGAKLTTEDGYQALAIKYFWVSAIILVITVLIAVLIPSSEVIALKAVAEGDTTPQIIELAKKWSIK